jgi:hypothetical protein
VYFLCNYDVRPFPRTALHCSIYQKQCSTEGSRHARYRKYALGESHARAAHLLRLLLGNNLLVHTCFDVQHACERLANQQFKHHTRDGVWIPDCEHLYNWLCKPPNS